MATPAGIIEGSGKFPDILVGPGAQEAGNATVIPIRPGLGVEIIPVPESPGALRPSDVRTYVYRDPEDRSPIAPLTVFAPAWTGEDGRHEPKIIAKARPYGAARSDMVKVMKVERPSYWREDNRPWDVQVREYEAGLAEIVRSAMDPELLNPFGQDSYRPPTQIEFTKLSGMAAEAFLALELPWRHELESELSYSGVDFATLAPIESVRKGGTLRAVLTFDRKDLTP